MKTLSVVVPVYFNEGSLPILAQRLATIETTLLSSDVAVELIFVDDGSRDTSWEQLLKIKAARPATKIVRLTRNFGAVHASKCGLQFITGDCFLIVAADLQDPPELILQLVERWQAGSKFVICARISRDDPPVSKLLATIYYRVLRLLVIRDYPRGGFDMALMDRAMLAPLQNSSKSLYTPLLAYWLGFKPDTVFYHRQPRLHGRSRWTFGKKFKAFLDVMLGFSVTPIRMISGLGAIVSLCSFGYGISVAIGALTGRVPVPGFASLVTLITFLLGLIIVMLGIIGEYLWRIFEETNKRPEVVIEEIL
jgi:glycosyltransferase involved in cell wall biosynthesis